ncbi:MAG TPA: hypothetical protein P5081_05050 [Phycisphaerae bacterium]|nr:hypothetical protein [Phycisphaerae bacterium]HRW52232.1 hypothetical protein [Phycisphaerae bacterium]
MATNVEDGARLARTSIVDPPTPPGDFLERWGAWVASTIDSKTGAMRDPYSRHPLHFQYHYPAAILGRLCDPNIPANDALTRRVWDYLNAIPYDEVAITVEFNAFLLALAHFAAADRGDDLADAIGRHFETIRLAPVSSLAKRNRNFAHMLQFALDYAATNIDIDRHDAYRRELDALLADSQPSDGLFIDTPAPAGGGYASSVYVAKIALTRLLGGVINCNDPYFDQGRLAIDALLSMADTDRILVYGRSQLSLFGYAGLYTCARILAFETEETPYIRAVDDIDAMFASWRRDSGELALNPGRDNVRRPGFDTYMHAVVYNAYAWGLYRFCDLVAPRDYGDATETTPAESNDAGRQVVIELPDAGLCRHHNDRIDVLVSARRFNDEPKLFSDPRYVPFAPQLVRVSGHDMIPPIPRDLGGFMRMAVRRSLSERLRSTIAAIRFVLSDTYADDFLERAGFLPYLVVGRNMKICPGTQRDLRVDATSEGLEMRCVFSMDAALNRRCPWKKEQQPVGESWGELKSIVRTTSNTMMFEHELVLSGAKRRAAACFHLNARLAKAPVAIRSAEGATILDLGDGCAIRHTPIAAAPKSTRCMGVTGDVTYLRASSPVRPGEPFHIRTTIAFEESALK